MKAFLSKNWPWIVLLATALAGYFMYKKMGPQTDGKSGDDLLVEGGAGEGDVIYDDATGTLVNGMTYGTFTDAKNSFDIAVQITDFNYKEGHFNVTMKAHNMYLNGDNLRWYMKSEGTDPWKSESLNGTKYGGGWPKNFDFEIGNARYVSFPVIDSNGHRKTYLYVFDITNKQPSVINAANAKKATAINWQTGTITTVK